MARISRFWSSDRERVMAEMVSLSVSDSLISSGDIPADSKMIGAGRWERRVFRVWVGM